VQAKRLTANLGWVATALRQATSVFQVDGERSKWHRSAGGEPKQREEIFRTRLAPGQAGLLESAADYRFAFPGG